MNSTLFQAIRSKNIINIIRIFKSQNCIPCNSIDREKIITLTNTYNFPMALEYLHEKRIFQDFDNKNCLQKELVTALQNKRESMAKLLVQLFGVSLNGFRRNKTDRMVFPLLILVDSGLSLELLDLFMKNGADVNEVDQLYSDKTVFGEICKLVNKEKYVSYFVGHSKTLLNMGELHIACSFGHFLYVKLLCEHGNTNVNCLWRGKSPLNALLSSNLDVEQKNQISEFLVEQGALSNIEGSLHYCSSVGLANICDLLISKGEDYYSRDAEGRFAWEFCKDEATLEVFDRWRKIIQKKERYEIELFCREVAKRRNLVLDDHHLVLQKIRSFPNLKTILVSDYSRFGDPWKEEFDQLKLMGRYLKHYLLGQLPFRGHSHCKYGQRERNIFTKYLEENLLVFFQDYHVRKYELLSLSESLLTDTYINVSFLLYYCPSGVSEIQKLSKTGFSSPPELHKTPEPLDKTFGMKENLSLVVGKDEHKVCPLMLVYYS